MYQRVCIIPGHEQVYIPHRLSEKEVDLSLLHDQHRGFSEFVDNRLTNIKNVSLRPMATQYQRKQKGLLYAICQIVIKQLRAE